jgi:hypothetical protein
VNAKKMFLSFIPWIAFSLLAQRRGADGATISCLVAFGLALWFAVKDSKSSSLKIIDATGVVTFGLMGIVAFVGGPSVDRNVIDFGRGGAAIVLGLIMLTSVLFVPFTEQYARETVPAQYWGSPVFRAVNRRISAVWALAVLVMGGGHLLAGWLDPASSANTSSRPIDLFFNWALPVALILLAIKYTDKTAAAAGEHDAPAVPAHTESIYR